MLLYITCLCLLLAEEFLKSIIIIDLNSENELLAAAFRAKHTAALLFVERRHVKAPVFLQYQSGEMEGTFGVEALM